MLLETGGWVQVLGTTRPSKKGMDIVKASSEAYSLCSSLTCLPLTTSTLHSVLEDTWQGYVDTWWAEGQC